MGTVLWDMFPEPEKTEGYRMHHKALNERISVQWETYSPNLKVWVGANAYPISDGGIAVYFRDITERKNSEQALEENKKRLESEVTTLQRLYDLQSKMSREKDIMRAIDEILAAACDLANTDRATMQLVREDGVFEIVAQRGYAESSPFITYFREGGFEDGCHRACRERIRIIIEDAANCPGLLGTEAGAITIGDDVLAAQSTPLVSRSGTSIGVLSTQYRRPYRPSDGEMRLLDQLSFLAAEFIERHRAEEALRISERRYRNQIEDALRESQNSYHLLLDSMDQGFGIIEMMFNETGYPINYRFIDCNPAFEKLTGMAVKGKFQTDIFPETEEFWYKKFGQVALTGEPIRFTNVVKELDRWYDYYAFKVGEHDSRIVGILLDEITYRIKAEQAIRESEQKALALVAELEKADKNKNEFINAMSHELRNPLAAVVAGLSLMDITEDKQKIAQANDIIRRQTNQLCHLVDGLLDLTRITNNKIKLKKESIELTDLTTSAVEDHRFLFDNKGINLVVCLSPKKIFLEVDPIRIEQIIGNLLHNAAKFTSKNDVVIVKVTQDTNTSEAVITVMDTGRGIDSKDLGNLFTPFTQIDKSLDRSLGGLGLGLSIVKGMVELHGGRVEAYSEGIGKGTKFTIRLPLQKKNIVT